MHVIWSASATIFKYPNVIWLKSLGKRNGHAYYGREKQDRKKELQSTGMKYSLGSLGRRACENDRGDHEETKTCRAARSTPRSGLETYLVTFTVLYLLIWFALFDWTFHFKNLEIKENTSKFHFKHLLASYLQKQKHSKYTITSLPKRHFFTHLLLF